MPKAFIHDGLTFACIVHWGSPEGRQLIDINSEVFTPSKARKLSAWLLEAANQVEKHNRRRKRPPAGGGEG